MTLKEKCDVEKLQREKKRIMELKSRPCSQYQRRAYEFEVIRIDRVIKRLVGQAVGSSRLAVGSQEVGNPPASSMPTSFPKGRPENG